ncbi:hypothetical protein [Desulfosarcina alkanivorans]|uniref:hypothetical protein n=1 Tax=Desulfosarcina alkanivorans TaxID=571177 RepID=UPI0012D36920|nr:hypothetical protein [Desulfosarcina alkanivorans]
MKEFDFFEPNTPFRHQSHMMWLKKAVAIQEVFGAGCFAMYPFTYLDFREKPGRHPEGRLSQYLTGLTDTRLSQCI